MLASLLRTEVRDWLQKSISSELYASQLYKSLANQLQRKGLFNIQKFFLGESSDELTHYQILVDYMNDRNDCADLPMIPPIADRIIDAGDALRIAYETELSLLNQYVEFYEMCEDEQMEDCTTAQFILQFIEIQRKAVGEYGDLISYYNSIEINKNVELDKFFHEKNEA